MKEDTEIESKGKLKIVAAVLVFGMLVVGGVLFRYGNTQEVSVPPRVSPSPSHTIHVSEAHIQYSGQAGKDALTLLKEHTKVEQDKSGLVVSINNSRPDSGKHEYWAFYVNGKLASVGPADYKTKDSDTIEWKIEKY